MMLSWDVEGHEFSGLSLLWSSVCKWECVGRRISHMALCACLLYATPLITCTHVTCMGEYFSGTLQKCTRLF